AKDAPVRTPKDLAGGTIGVGALGDFNQLTVMAWLERNGVARDAVQYVELRFGEVGAALQRGTVKAAFITEPFKSDAVRAGLIRDFADTYLAVAPEIAVVVWFASKSWLQRNPDAAKRLVTGIYATARYANTHYQQTAEILARVAKLDAAVIEKMVRAYFATSNDRKYVQDMLQLAARYGLVQRPVTFEEYCPPLQTA
ncbi:MAG: ABC transporter substrate-binding protein, partial [Candidatus Eremiobacteraeota bacterium]|nr:ABC transporter substrate-binding protein [Candidatus Eremiobacteraeota bacterium]